METFSDMNMTPFWDLSQASQFSQLPDDDFLALLQKQFPSVGGDNFSTNTFDGVNPRSLTSFPAPTFSPPSEESSPSPPSSSKDSTDGRNDEEAGEPPLKRKASQDDLDDEGPSHKTQHTATTSTKKGAGNGRRKSAGGNNTLTAEESRLLKRKEQNRAAQRAFRERKEKHVKDLEDQVAALEAKNQEASSENQNLRDMLQRLQSENMALKQAQFTFAVPKNPSTNERGSLSSDAMLFNLPRSGSTSSSPSAVSPPNSNGSPIDWNTLTTFDNNSMHLLDDTPQPTASSSAMQMNLGGFETGKPSPPDSNGFNFNGMNWQSDSANLDDLFAGYLSQGSGPVDINVMLATSPPTNGNGNGSNGNGGGSSITGISPVIHNYTPAALRSNSSISTPAATHSASPVDSVSIRTPPEQSSGDSTQHIPGNECPRTKAEFQKHSEELGESAFTSPSPSSAFTSPPPTSAAEDAALASGEACSTPMGVVNNLRKGMDGTIMCKGTQFPKTEKSDKNIEVLKAWRTITNSPLYKDVDINELCSEFTSKARCDGTKVVLEPSGVNKILEGLKTKGPGH
ncbi:hypothetical protein BD626DRAFT_43238 [Schizophyllum amplum]|uniref:BZIP domain-containing protein n=1 Tax=Schizophyllum amplum TaxID=97359 RepID=A0A550CDS1_9AGAR|nr:hypothetical protein BD626DRAFT_43238 [Auriculariopsis ampla]